MSKRTWHSTLRALCCGAAAVGLLAIPAMAAAQNAPDVDIDYDNGAVTGNQFTVSGNIGGTFGTESNLDQAGVNFGGALSYLHNGMFGGEFLAGFAPNLNLDLVSGTNNDVNDYMFNLIAAAPFGVEGRWQPFVSGGIGAITLHQGNLSLFDSNDSEPGANIGVGLMGFQDQWGFRTELRYFTQIGSTTQPAPGVGIPDGFNFWRANAGVAYRW
jgi:hypothetical protein